MEMQSQLTVLTAILPGQEARLRALLQQLPGGAESPFGAQGTLGRTHYARFAVIDRLDLEPENPDPDRLSAPYLLFSAVVDGSEDSYLEALSRTMSPQLAAVWRCCVDYECKEKQGRLSEYFKRHKQGVTYLFHGYYASVDAVRDALKDRKRMIEFVQKAQFLGAAEQRRSFRVTFETGPDEDAPGGGGSA
jgi:hypothetical protein